MLTPSERVHLILEIGRRLGSESWSVIDLTLRQFGAPTSDGWQGTAESYVLGMIETVASEVLMELARHLGYDDSPRVHRPSPRFWSDGQFRLFVSHLAVFKQDAGLLRDELERYGVASFVAHTDIEPTSEWQNDIELALATADAMVALLHPNFHQSNWTDQEIGHAMGRDLLVVAVRLGQDPYGFIGRFQAVSGIGRSAKLLAKDLAEILVRHKKSGQRMTEALVARVETASAFVDTLSAVPVLQQSPWGSPELAARCEVAVLNNSQVSGAWGMSAAIAEMVDKWRAVPHG